MRVKQTQGSDTGNIYSTSSTSTTPSTVTSIFISGWPRLPTRITSVAATRKDLLFSCSVDIPAILAICYSLLDEVLEVVQTMSVETKLFSA